MKNVPKQATTQWNLISRQFHSNKFYFVFCQEKIKLMLHIFKHKKIENSSKCIIIKDVSFGHNLQISMFIH